MKLFCTLFFLWFSFVVKGQEVIFVDQSQDHQGLEIYIFDKTLFDAHQVAFKDSVKLFCAKLSTPRNIQIHIRFSSTNLPYYSFSARPALTDMERHQLQKTLMHLPALKTNRLIYTKEFNVTINGGGPKHIPYSPLLEDASKVKKEPYEFGNLADDFNQINEWASEVESIVIANSVETAVDKTSIEKLVVNVYDYALNSTLNAISEGRFDYAQNMITVFISLTPRASLTHYLFKELQWRLVYYFRAEKRICYTLPQKEGDRFGKNLIALDSILSINPMSGFALFETLKQGIPTEKDLRVSYEQTRQNFNFANPIRTDTLLPRTAAEAYQNTLRIQFLNLIKDLKTTNKVEEIAEIGLELGAYEFSNLVYSILSFKSLEFEKNGNPVYSLRGKYSVYKMDPTRKTFLKNELKQFKQLESELKKKMVNSLVYKEFKKRK